MNILKRLLLKDKSSTKHKWKAVKFTNGLVITEVVPRKPGKSPKKGLENLLQKKTYTNKENHQQMAGRYNCKKSHSSCNTDKYLNVYKTLNVNKQ